MLNRIALQKRIEESGLKKSYIAKEMGLTPYGLAKKLDGITEFKISEAGKLCRILNIVDSDEKDEIFLTANMTDNHID